MVCHCWKKMISPSQSISRCWIVTHFRTICHIGCRTFRTIKVLDGHLRIRDFWWQFKKGYFVLFCSVLTSIIFEVEQMNLKELIEFENLETFKYIYFVVFNKPNKLTKKYFRYETIQIFVFWKLLTENCSQQLYNWCHFFVQPGRSTFYIDANCAFDFLLC